MSVYKDLACILEIDGNTPVDDRLDVPEAPIRPLRMADHGPGLDQGVEWWHWE